MPITFTKSYLTSDGQSWTKLQDAQQREIALLLAKDGDNPEHPTDTMNADAFLIVRNRDAVLAILKQKERQRTRTAKPKRVRAVATKPAEVTV